MMLFIIIILNQMKQIMKGNNHMLSKDEFLNFKQADFSKPAEEELAISEMIQDAHWAHPSPAPGQYRTDRPPASKGIAG